jgi:hypothetical protein
MNVLELISSGPSLFFCSKYAFFAGGDVLRPFFFNRSDYLNIGELGVDYMSSGP